MIAKAFLDTLDWTLAEITPFTEADKTARFAHWDDVGFHPPPIVVWADGESNRLVDGRCRLLYALARGQLTKVAVDFRAFPDEGAAVDFVLDCAKGEGKRLTVHQITAIALLAGRRPSHASALAKLPREALERIRDGKSTPIQERRAAGLIRSRAPKAAAAPVDPVTRYQESKATSRLKSEHRELLATVEEANERLRLHESFGRTPLEPVRRYEFTSGLREGTAVALLSDVHCEERVLAGDTPTGNEYDLEVAERRIGRFFAGVEWLVEKERTATQIRTLVLWFGGDMMSGQIHEENLETSAAPPIPTLLWLRPQLVSGIERLVAADLDVRLVCSYGNHGRDTKRCNFATGAHHSYEWGMYQELAMRFADHPRVQVLADPSEHQYVKVYDFDLHFHHGHRVNYGGGVGGITIPLNKAVAQWDRVRRCDYHHFGHFHQYIDTGNVLVNGSVIGYNSYAMGIKASPEPPQQAFYVLDSKRGKTAKSPVWVAESAG